METLLRSQGQGMENPLLPPDLTCSNVLRVFKIKEFLVRSWGPPGGSEHLFILCLALLNLDTSIRGHLAVQLCDEIVSHHNSNYLPN